MRSGLAAPYNAPHTWSASADNNVVMKVVRILRSGSPDVWDNGPSRKRAGSILDTTVIAVVHFGTDPMVPSKDHAAAVDRFTATRSFSDPSIT